MDATTKMTTQAHIVVCPFRDHGHTIPAMHLSNKLAAHYSLSVTVFCTAESSYTRALSLVQPNLPHLKVVYHRSTDVGFMSRGSGQEEETEVFTEFLTSNTPMCIIVDAMIANSFVSVVASKLGIPRYHFYTSGASALEVQISRPPGGARRGGPMGGRGLADTGFRPGMGRFGHGRGGDGGRGRGSPSERGINPELPGFVGMMINTFDELEGGKVDDLPTEVKAVGIGPLLPADVFEQNALKMLSRSGNSDESLCLEWLDQQPPSSVIYISFGTRAFLSEYQITELAKGLEKSAQKFLWVLPPLPNKPAEDRYCQLPEGFEDTVGKRGLILPGWAPQLLILAHPATGAFLTHCGWNSSLESICMGKPMLAWPLMADQSTICDFLVHRAGAAVEAEKDEEGIVGREEVELKVRLIMEGDEGHGLRTKVRELRERARTAVAVGGSSQNHMDHFVEQITAKVQKQ